MNLAELILVVGAVSVYRVEPFRCPPHAAQICRDCLEDAEFRVGPWLFCERCLRDHVRFRRVGEWFRPARG